MLVAITCNIMPEGYLRESGDDTYAEFDSPSTVEAIRNALMDLCDEVRVIEADESAYEKLRGGGFDFVFNIAEGQRGEARESQIPAILEMLGIPYTGSGVGTLAVTLDKRRCKEVLLANGIRTPEFQLIRSLKDLKTSLKYPLFVKPNNEGSSRGITAKSLVQNQSELYETVSEILERFRQPAIAEEYLSGREFTVSLIGNSEPLVLPIVEVDFSNLPEKALKFDCYEVKWIYDSKLAGYDTTHCPARIDDDLLQKIEETAKRTFEALEIRDLCRMDIRLDDEGEPSVLDVNALPGLIPDPAENSRFPKAAYTAGYTYNELICAIFCAALKRTGISL